MNNLYFEFDAHCNDKRWRDEFCFMWRTYEKNPYLFTLIMQSIYITVYEGVITGE